MKKFIALTLAATLLVCSFLAFGVSAAEAGTQENPENANDRYFAAAKSYLLNTNLSEGDKDGYWYQFTVPSAGYMCVDAIAKDLNGADTDLFQVTVYCNGAVYYAFDEVFARPIVPQRVSKGDVVTIHLESKADENGTNPALKFYCSVAMVSGTTDTDPIFVKSKEGFIIELKAERSVVVQDGTNGGLYGGKGIEISADADIIANTVLDVNGIEYKDTDGDGIIELMLPGDPGAQIPLHPIITIYNNSKNDGRYVARLVEYAQEGVNETCQHTLEYVEIVKEPDVKEEGIAIYKCTLCGETVEVPIPTLEAWEKGDVNNDGKINSLDSNMLKRILVGVDVTAQERYAADVNDDGLVNSIDANILSRRIAGSSY